LAAGLFRAAGRRRAGLRHPRLFRPAGPGQAPVDGPAQRPGGNGQAHPRLRRRGRRPPAHDAAEVRPLMTSRPTEIGTARLSGRRDEPAAPETAPDSARTLPAPLTAEQIEDVRKAVV